MSYVGFASAALIGIASMVLQMHADNAKVIPTPAVTVTIPATNTLPPCAFDEFDSSIPNCVYDARTRGNHKGTPFIIYNGESYSLKK